MQKIICAIVILSSFGCATTRTTDAVSTYEKIQSLKEAQNNMKNPYERLSNSSNFLFFWQKWSF